MVVAKRVERQESIVIINAQKSINYNAATKLWTFIKDGTTESVWWNKHTNCKAVAHVAARALAVLTAVVVIEAIACFWGGVGSFIMGCEYDKSRDRAAALFDKIVFKVPEDPSSNAFPVVASFVPPVGYFGETRKAYNDRVINAPKKAIQHHAQLIAKTFEGVASVDLGHIIKAAVDDFKNSSAFKALPTDNQIYAESALKLALWSEQIPAVLTKRMKEENPVERQKLLAGEDAYHGVGLGDILANFAAQAISQGLVNDDGVPRVTVQSLYKAMVKSLEKTSDLEDLSVKMTEQHKKLQDAEDADVDAEYQKRLESLDAKLNVNRDSIEGIIGNDQFPGFGDFIKEVEQGRVPLLTTIYAELDGLRQQKAELLEEAAVAWKTLVTKDFYVSSEVLNQRFEDMKVDLLAAKEDQILKTKGKNAKATLRDEKRVLEEKFTEIEGLMTELTNFDQEHLFDKQLSELQGFYEEKRTLLSQLENLKARHEDVADLRTSLTARATEALDFVIDAQNLNRYIHDVEYKSNQPFLNPAEDGVSERPASGLFVPVKIENADSADYAWKQIDASRKALGAKDVHAVVDPEGDSENPEVTQMLAEMAQISQDQPQRLKMIAHLEREIENSDGSNSEIQVKAKLALIKEEYLSQEEYLTSLFKQLENSFPQLRSSNDAARLGNVAAKNLRDSFNYQIKAIQREIDAIMVTSDFSERKSIVKSINKNLRKLEAEGKLETQIAKKLIVQRADMVSAIDNAEAAMALLRDQEGSLVEKIRWISASAADALPADDDADEGDEF